MNINYYINSINNNKYFYGILMILLNVGARYIEVDLDDSHKAFLSSTLVRRLIIFTIAFIATRDIIASFIITATFIIIVLNLFNTTSKNCILPKSFIKLDKNKDGIISPQEIKSAYDTLKKAGKL